MKFSSFSHLFFALFAFFFAINCGKVTAAQSADEMVESLKSGNCSEVADSVRAAIERADSLTAESVYFRGLASKCAGDLDSAESDFYRAAELDPMFYHAYYSLGLVDFENGDYLDAIHKFNTAARIKPDHALAYFYRGMARYKLGDYRDAFMDFNGVIELYAFMDRDGLKSKFGRFEYYETVPKNKADGKKPNLERAEAIKMRGTASLAMGDVHPALSDLSAALAVLREDPELNFRLGKAFRLIEDGTSAAEFISRAIRIDSTNSSFYLERGRAYLLLSDIKKACADFEEAKNLGSETAVEFIRKNCETQLAD